MMANALEGPQPFFSSSCLAHAIREMAFLSEKDTR
jgi:hypothetical protein